MKITRTTLKELTKRLNGIIECDAPRIDNEELSERYGKIVEEITTVFNTLHLFHGIQGIGKLVIEANILVRSKQALFTDDSNGNNFIDVMSKASCVIVKKNLTPLLEKMEELCELTDKFHDFYTS